MIKDLEQSCCDSPKMTTFILVPRQGPNETCRLFCLNGWGSMQLTTLTYQLLHCFEYLLSQVQNVVIFLLLGLLYGWMNKVLCVYCLVLIQNHFHGQRPKRQHIHKGCLRSRHLLSSMFIKLLSRVLVMPTWMRSILFRWSKLRFMWWRFVIDYPYKSYDNCCSQY